MAKAKEKTENANLNSDTEDTNDIVGEILGPQGRWQLKIALLMALLKLPIAWYLLSVVFLAPPTTFWCKQSSESYDISQNLWRQLSTPANGTYLKHEGLNTGYCHMKNLTELKTHNILLEANDTEIEVIPCNNGYNYDHSIFGSSIVTEWNLVCDNQRLVDITQIVLMAGVLVGNLIFGVLSDRHGRKPVLCWCISIQALSTAIASWSPWYWTFVVLRFVGAAASGGTAVASFVVCMEAVGGGKWATILPVLYQVPYGLGTSVLAVLAWWLRHDWRFLHSALAALSAIYVLYVWLVPESPRWLFAVGRREEAMKVLQMAARYNGRESEFVQKMVDCGKPSGAISIGSKPPIGILFRHAELRRRLMLLMINWFLAGLTFYGLTQYAGGISGGARDLHWTAALSGLATIPGPVFCLLAMKYLGRRATVAVGQLLTGVCLLIILTLPDGARWCRIGLAGVAVIGLTVSMPALYLFTGELFPTVARNGGMGLSLTASRIGSMIAPLVVALHGITTWLPLAFMATTAVLNAILVLPLPETSRLQSLPDTVQDLENDSRQSNRDSQLKHYIIVPLKQVQEDM